MRSLPALLIHFLKSVSRFFTKILRRDRLFFASWPGIAFVLRVIGLASQGVTPESCPNRRAIVLTGSEDSFATGRVPGQDLTDLSTRWLKETLGFKELKSVVSLELVAQSEAPDITLVTYDWLLENYQRPLRSAYSLSRQLRRLKSPVFVILPDGFWLRLTAFGSLITALAGGSQILLQDSEADHRKFGTLRPTGPHFWTWPPSHLDAWQSATSWSERQKLALIAGTGGGQYRNWVMQQIEPKLNIAGYKTSRTQFNLGWDSYIKLNQVSQIVVTTCKMHPDYFRGPRYYRELIPQLTVTGRVWEAFASGNVLITDQNPILEELGFKAGQHYLPLPGLSETAWVGWVLPTDRTLAEIAERGNEHFRNCVESRLRNSLSNGPRGT